MRSHYAVMALAAFAAFACQGTEDPVAPAAPGESAPTVSLATCPCWDQATLAVAFPAVHFFREAGGTAALTRFDLPSAQQIQALVRFASDGPGSCELASFGTAGLVEAMATASTLSPAQCEACAALLEAPAAAFGFAAHPTGGDSSP